MFYSIGLDLWHLGGSYWQLCRDFAQALLGVAHDGKIQMFRISDTLFVRRPAFCRCTARVERDTIVCMDARRQAVAKTVEYKTPCRWEYVFDLPGLVVWNAIRIAIAIDIAPVMRRLHRNGIVSIHVNLTEKVLLCHGMHRKNVCCHSIGYP